MGEDSGIVGENLELEGGGGGFPLTPFIPPPKCYKSDFLFLS